MSLNRVLNENIIYSYIITTVHLNSLRISVHFCCQKMRECSPKKSSHSYYSFIDIIIRDVASGYVWLRNSLIHWNRIVYVFRVTLEHIWISIFKLNPGTGLKLMIWTKAPERMGASPSKPPWHLYLLLHKITKSCVSIVGWTLAAMHPFSSVYSTRLIAKDWTCFQLLFLVECIT